MKRIIAHYLVICVLITTTGCATNPSNISAKYVSPIAYQDWTCEQLVDEHKRLTSVVEKTVKDQKKNASTDAGLMAVGLIIFWPALIGLAATRNEKEAVAQVKGEYEAVHEQMRMKGCPVPAPVPSEQVTTAAEEDEAATTRKGNSTTNVKTRDWSSYKGDGPPDEWLINK